MMLQCESGMLQSEPFLLQSESMLLRHNVDVQQMKSILQQCDLAPRRIRLRCGIVGSLCSKAISLCSAVC